MTATSATLRAEHVGSLLRPPELLRARDEHKQGRLSLQQLREQEDAAVLAALELQLQTGLELFTDGELRRESFLASLRESVGGVVEVDLAQSKDLRWTRDGEEPPPEETTQFPLAVGEKLTFREPLSAVEAAFLTDHSPGSFKVAMASATLGMALWVPGVTDAVYPTPFDMLQDYVAMEVREIQTLVDGGVRWIQIDSLTYNSVMDPSLAEQTMPSGFDPKAHLDGAVATDNALIRAAKAKDPEVTVALHICRGNNRSAWASEGGYEPVAERLFGEVEADRFLLEYDDERSGGFEPLRFVPPGKTVVLGLVSSKTPELESGDELRRRIDEASRYVPLENLALSLQCGFASTALGNLVTVDDQRRKLELVVDTAQKVWG